MVNTNPDSDGKTLLHEPWGWATSRTQWCGLPLADFDDLDAYLDAYLADPPAATGEWKRPCTSR